MLHERSKLSLLIKLSLVGLLVIMTTSMVNPLLSLYVRIKFQASPSEIALVFLMFTLMSVVVRLYVIMLVRPQYVITTLALGSLFMSIAPLLYVYSPSLPIFLLIRALHGLGNSLVWPMLMTLIPFAALKIRLDRAFAIHSASNAFGMMIGPAIAALATAFIGIEGAFILATFIGLLGFTVSCLAKPPKTKEVKVSVREMLKELMKLIKRREILIPSICFGSFGFTMNVFFAYAPILAKDTFNLSEPVIVTIFFGYNALAFFSRIVMAKFRISNNIEKLIGIELAIVFGFAILASLSTDPILFALFIALFGIGHGLTYPLNAILIASRTKIEERIPANTLFQAFWDIGLLSGPPLSSIFIYIFDIRAGLIVGALVTAFGSFLALYSHFKVSIKKFSK